MQLAWAAYGVTIIPSRHVFDSMPAPPAVLNRANGALTQAQAQDFALAYNRTDALWGWADAHDQIKLQLYLSNQGFLNTAAGDAESKGQPVTDQPCALYPEKAAVVSVDSSIKSFQEAHGYTVASPYALVLLFKTPCSQTAATSSGPKTIWQFAFGLNINLETGSVRNDALLGVVYSAEAGRVCPNAGFPTPGVGETLPPGFVPTPGGEGGPEACYVFGG
jgi:hypothetical protein